MLKSDLIIPIQVHMSGRGVSRQTIEDVTKGYRRKSVAELKRLLGLEVQMGEYASAARARAGQCPNEGRD